MNKIIRDQLNKVTSVKLDFDDNTTELYIPKVEKISNSSLKIGNVYKIELSDKLLYPSSTSTFSSNWNKGLVPKNKIYLVEIIDIMSGYIKCNGVAANDNSDSWFGWFPLNDITILSRE